jgi:hypothetical protein
MNTLLDRHVEDEHGGFGWTGPDEEVNSHINELPSSVGTFLYGRKMHEAMVYWESAYAAHDHPQFLWEWARLWQGEGEHSCRDTRGWTPPALDGCGLRPPC